MMEPWSDLSVPQKLLRDMKKDETIKVIGYDLVGVGEPGDNYMSEVKRVLIKYKREKNSSEIDDEMWLFTKRILSHFQGPTKELIQVAFLNEIEVMSGLLKEMNKILDFQVGPVLLHSQPDEPFLIMEDLTPRGFLLPSRLTGLDLPHSLLAIRTLARFHAASVAVCEKTPEYGEKLRRPFSHLDKHEPIIKAGLADVADVIEKWPELGPRYSERLFKLIENLMPNIQAACTCRDEDFNVLNHGDCSQINILFAYDHQNHQNKPVNCTFVDFQFSNYNNPAVDLHYFLGSSVTEDVYDNYQNHLLKEYHQVLSDTMKMLKCKTTVPDITEVKKMMDDRLFVSLISSCLLEPILHSLPSDVLSFEQMESIGLPENKKRLQREGYRKMLTSRLIQYEKLGLFDSWQYKI